MELENLLWRGGRVELRVGIDLGEIAEAAELLRRRRIRIELSAERRGPELFEGNQLGWY